MADGERQAQIFYDPPRLRWTKRIAIGSVALVLLTAGLFTTANIITQRRLDDLIASYRAAGEPINVEDFNVFEAIPGDENAATYYKQAERSYVWPARLDYGIKRAILGALDRSYLEKYETEVARFLNTNGATFEALREGSRCSAAEWGITITSPMINWRPYLPGTRQLAELINVAMEQAFENERHDDFAEYLWQSFRLERHRTAGPPTISTHLVSIYAGRFAYDAIEALGHKLVITIDSETSGHATNQQIQALIRELSDEGHFSGARSRGVWQERAQVLEAFELLGAGHPVVNWLDPYPLNFVWAIRPILLMSAVRSAKILSGLEHALAESVYPDAIERMSTTRDIASHLTLELIDEAAPIAVWERMVFLDFRFRAVRRMAMAALAIRMFEVDHGYRPSDLDQLVPNYLDSVPRDPFSADNAPIRYLPDGLPPVLYSVGINAKDDGGKVGRHPWGRIDDQAMDFVFFVNGDRRKWEFREPSTP